MSASVNQIPRPGRRLRPQSSKVNQGRKRRGNQTLQKQRQTSGKHFHTRNMTMDQPEAVLPLGKLNNYNTISRKTVNSSEEPTDYKSR